MFLLLNTSNTSKTPLWIFIWGQITVLKSFATRASPDLSHTAGCRVLPRCQSLGLDSVTSARTSTPLPKYSKGWRPAAALGSLFKWLIACMCLISHLNESGSSFWPPVLEKVLSVPGIFSPGVGIVMQGTCCSAQASPTRPVAPAPKAEAESQPDTK